MLMVGFGAMDHNSYLGILSTQNISLYTLQSQLNIKLNIDVGYIDKIFFFYLIPLAMLNIFIKMVIGTFTEY